MMCMKHTTNMYLVIVILFVTAIGAQRIPLLRTCSGEPCPAIPPAIPPKCIQEEKFRLLGTEVCYDCAYVIPNCDSSLNNTREEYIPACPRLRCPALPPVADSCIRKGPIQWLRSGQRCRLCPAVNPFCLELDLPLCKTEVATCSGVPHGTAIPCIDQKVIGVKEACLSCPRLKPECSSPVAETPLCNTCKSLPNIPARCITLGSVTRLPSGKVCRECPKPDPFCRGLSLPLCLPSSCNSLPSDVPRSCIIQNVEEHGKGPCLTCPTIRGECRLPTETLAPCPHNRCLRIPRGYPPQCIMAGFIETVSNQVCRGCPFADPFCPGLRLKLCPEELIGCIGISPDTDKKCISQNVIDDPRGPCLTCPTLKPECISLSEKDGIKPCAHELCPSLAGIPLQCVTSGPIKETTTGKCRGCPIIYPFCSALNLQVCPSLARDCVLPPLGTTSSCLDAKVLREIDLCISCPTIRPSCRRDSAVKPCPDNACVPLTGIPSTCVRAAPYKSLQDGTQCIGCLTIDPFCPGLNLQICQNHLLDCFGVPAGTANQCIDQQVLYNNGHCLSCPSLKPECLPPPDKDGLRPCVINKCETYKSIPSNCYELGPRVFLSNGVECRGCPTFNPFCKDLKIAICPSQIAVCTVLPIDVPLTCKTADIMEEGGAVCLSCPRIKLECQSPLPDPPTPTNPVLPTGPTGVSPTGSTGVSPTGPVPEPPVLPTLPSLQSNSTTPVETIARCPSLECFDTVGIPATCLIDAAIIYQEDGTKCLGCKQIDAKCTDLSLSVCAALADTCIELPFGVPGTCIAQQVVYHSGHCLTCPVLVPECHKYRKCPNTICPSLKALPIKCILPGQQKSLPNGDQCTECPTVDPGCDMPELPLCAGVTCTDIPPEYSKSCIKRKVLIKDGKPCNSCPAMDPECEENPLANNPFLNPPNA